jgi:hypothetical protein
LFKRFGFGWHAIICERLLIENHFYLFCRFPTTQNDLTPASFLREMHQDSSKVNQDVGH